MSTTDMVPSLIDDQEFLAQLDALDVCDTYDDDSARHAGQIRRDHRGAQATSHAPQRERSLPFWEERMREGAAAFDEIDDPDPELTASPTGLSRAAAFLGLMLCSAAGAGAAALVFHDRLAHLFR